MIKFTKFLLFSIFLIFIILYLTFREDKVVDPDSLKYSLTQHGVCVLHGVLGEQEIDYIRSQCETDNYLGVKQYLSNSKSINDVIYNQIGDEYTMHDYIWIIKKSSVHTCHRDNNGDFFNQGQKHPSYTMLIYIEDMGKCLGVIPESHKSKYMNGINIIDNVKNISCKKGDIIIFNSNLIHVGTLLPKDDHLRIQMKISHKDDLDVLSYYQDFNKVLNTDSKVPKPMRKFQKNLSCTFPIVSDMTQTQNIMSARGTDNGAKIGLGQKIFSYLFYGNSNFYDLPNAF